jgi:membrane-associated phospholipid phosphatase
MTDLHTYPPMTLARVEARLAWVLPFVALVFVLLAIGARLDTLPWDRPITDAAIDARTPAMNTVAKAISRLGSTPVVVVVAGVSALVAWRRCPRLAVAIVALALARPLVEFGLKELISRDRPDGNQLVGGRGPSFPSGHPFATAASWGLVPLVVALYTKKRAMWWAVSVGVWCMIVLVAASRVWLGVHWTSDVIASLLLVVLGVAAAERFIIAAHAGSGCAEARAATRL